MPRPFIKYFNERTFPLMYLEKELSTEEILKRIDYRISEVAIRITLRQLAKLEYVSVRKEANSREIGAPINVYTITEKGVEMLRKTTEFYSLGDEQWLKAKQ